MAKLSIRNSEEKHGQASILGNGFESMNPTQYLNVMYDRIRDLQ
jgi:hypothetical protein